MYIVLEKYVFDYARGKKTVPATVQILVNQANLKTSRAASRDMKAPGVRAIPPLVVLLAPAALPLLVLLAPPLPEGAVADGAPKAVAPLGIGPGSADAEAPCPTRAPCPC